jgi:hypothetical protein
METSIKNSKESSGSSVLASNNLEEQPNKRNNCNSCFKNSSNSDLVHGLILPRETRGAGAKYNTAGAAH